MIIRIPAYHRRGRAGWLRLWVIGSHYGPGVSWKPASEALLFSERNGYCRVLVCCGIRWRWLPCMDHSNDLEER